jgi:thiamine biosynthesis lipoprotein
LAKKAWLFLSLCLLLLSGCAPSEKWNTSTVIYFDTVCEIKIFSSPAEFRIAKEEVHRIFSEVDSLFSPESEDLTSPQVISLFHKALGVYHNSDGDFDISVAPLAELWGFPDRAFRIPSTDEVQRTLELVGMTKIKEAGNELVLPSGMKFDWGGIAKGYGVDKAVKSLQKIGINRGFINSGGDLYCWGTNPDDQSWQIGIKHPRSEGFAGVLSIANIGMATTGDYQRYFIKDGVRYHHIFNPRTGFPAEGKQSVTVIGPETTLCDALATALFISAAPEMVLDHYPDYGAIIISADGRLYQLGKEFSFQPMHEGK